MLTLSINSERLFARLSFRYNLKRLSLATKRCMDILRLNHAWLTKLSLIALLSSLIA